MDVLCQAKSGMGKTAVFVLATLQQIEPVNGQVDVGFSLGQGPAWQCNLGVHETASISSLSAFEFKLGSETILTAVTTVTADFFCRCSNTIIIDSF